MSTHINWNSCARASFDWIPENFLSENARIILLNFLISNPQVPVKFLQIHLITGIADIVCPSEETLNAVKLKIRWFIANKVFLDFYTWGDGLVKKYDPSLASDLKNAALCSVEFLRSKGTYLCLKNLYKIGGVDIVALDYEDDDQIVTIKVKTSSKEAFDKCAKKIDDRHNEFKSTSFPIIKTLSRSNGISHQSHLPVPYGAKMALVKDNYLDMLFEEFNSVDSLEFDEDNRYLKIVASPQVTSMIVSKVLGRLSFNKRLPSIRKYRVFLSYLYRDIKVCSETGEATFLLIATDPAMVRVDFRDCIFDEDSLNILQKIESGQSDRMGNCRVEKFNFFANRNHISHNLRKRMRRGFSMFLDWERLPTLNDIKVSVRLGGVSFYVHKFSPDVSNPDKQSAEFSCDLKMNAGKMTKMLTGQGFKKGVGESFVTISFFDLSSNMRYSATLGWYQGIMGDNISIKRRRAKHIENVLIKNGNSITYQNFISSDTTSYSEGKLHMLEDFVNAAISSDVHCSEGLYHDDLFAVFNVSIVKRCTLVKGEFRVDIDRISKKTHQRNCKFEEVTRVNLSCPDLCAGIKQFQECPENTFIRKSIEQLYDKLIDCAEELSEVVDSKPFPTFVY